MKTWIEIKRTDVLHNVRQFLKLVKPSLVMAVVKANAYGHGLEPLVRILAAAPDFRARGWLAVDSLEEALQVKKFLGKTKIPILILGFTPSRNLKDVVINGFNQAVYELAQIKTLERLGARYKQPALIHLKLEVGTNRQGVGENDLDATIRLIKITKWARLVGIYSHFADAEDNPVYSARQLEKFNHLVELFSSRGITAPIRHMASSAAILRYPDTRLDAIRLGISLYGLYSVSSQLIKKNQKLRPALTWKTVVAQVKTIAKGETVGYGRTWRAKTKSTIAVLPIGYADGYSRVLGNAARVLINGHFAPVIGRICMNMCMVDVTSIPKVVAGDTVILIGGAKDKKITVEELANLCGTINYEIVARLNPFIPRIIV